jgi:cytochrome c oxidase assembly protein subunit 15
MRHLEAGLAIPDIPLAFGRVLPPVWDGKIAIHFAHRVGALLVCLGVFATVRHIWSHHRDRIELVRPALLLTALVIAQIGLGAMTVLSALHVWINSLHVVCGAVVLATSLVIALRSWRHRFRVTIEPESSTRASISIPAGEAHA